MLNISRIINNFYSWKQNIKVSFSTLFSYLNVKIYLVILLFINLTNWLFTRYITSEIDQPQIALHYSVDFGINLYGDINKIYILPLLGTIFIVINFVILSILARYNVKTLNLIPTFYF